MGARADALAKQFEAKVDEATETFEKLSDTDWRKVTSAEKWPVCVVAHHVAQAHAGISQLVKMVASGAQFSPHTMDDIHAMNAKHAQEFGSCTKPETLSLHKDNAKAAAALVRGLSDADLDRTGQLLKELPAMSANQVIVGILINHVDEHLKSIRATTEH